MLLNGGPAGRTFAVNKIYIMLIANENTVNVQSLEICLPYRVVRELVNVVETVEDRIQNAILTTIDNIITPLLNWQ